MCNVSTKVTFPRNGKYVKPIITVFDSDFVVCKNNRHFRGIPRTGCYSISVRQCKNIKIVQPLKQPKLEFNYHRGVKRVNSRNFLDKIVK